MSCCARKAMRIVSSFIIFVLTEGEEETKCNERANLRRQTGAREEEKCLEMFPKPRYIASGEESLLNIFRVVSSLSVRSFTFRRRRSTRERRAKQKSSIGDFCIKGATEQGSRTVGRVILISEESWSEVKRSLKNFHLDYWIIYDFRVFGGTLVDENKTKGKT